MSGFLKAVAIVLVAGAACIGGPQEAVAAGELEEGEQASEIPIYYLQLAEFDAARSEEGALQPMLLEYQIQPGDNLYNIALHFNTDVETLAGLNGIINPHFILAGDTIEVLTVPGTVHDVCDGDTVTSIAELYDVEEEAIVTANSLSVDGTLERGERVIVPGAILSRGTETPFFSWPLQGVITSGYGWRGSSFHYAIDIAAPLGTPFHASAGGRVTHAGWLGAYGIMVEVDHGNGYITRYAHAERVAVSVGEQVARGQVLGYVGVTGNTTGPHLHFELHRSGERLNPMHYLN